MRRQLNTVYVTTEGAWLRKEGLNVVMELEGEIKARLPIHMLEGMVCFGRVLLSPALMGFCAEQGITVTFLSAHGRFLARMEGPVSGNVLLRRQQYRSTHDPARCAAVVRHLLTGKLYNQRAVVGRALRDHGAKLDPTAADALSHAERRLALLSSKLPQVESVDVMRGMEGEAAQAYFAAFDGMVRVDEPEMHFGGRTRRPPRDPVNALLSFLYTLVTHDCRSALECVGLDPAVGFLHRDRPGRPSLALDLLEEFRPLLADRLALSLINLKQMGPRDFQRMDNGAVLLREESRKKVLVAYQERKREELRHAYTGEKAPIGLFPFLQAQLLARHLRGDLDAYPPFLWK